MTMNEFAIEWVRSQKVATVTFPNNTGMKSKLIKYAEEYPDEVNYIENKDGSVVGHVPSSWIKIRPKKNLSEEQKDAIRERFNKSLGR